MNRQEYWNQMYQTKGSHDVSWHQRRPDLSLALIAASGVGKDAAIIDVGGGASTLVDFPLDDGHTRLAVLDLSGVALSHSRIRHGARADRVEWFEADVTSFQPPHRFDLWHDRAVFHFLTAAEDRQRYVATLRRTLHSGGTVVLSTFALDGPPKCSGLDVMRYDESSILAELGTEVQLQEVRRETHMTPWQSEQHFIYFRFQWQNTLTGLLRGILEGRSVFLTRRASGCQGRLRETFWFVEAVQVAASGETETQQRSSSCGWILVDDGSMIRVGSCNRTFRK